MKYTKALDILVTVWSLFLIKKYIYHSMFLYVFKYFDVLRLNKPNFEKKKSCSLKWYTYFIK